ncbi:alpha/beta hydrolase [Sporosarcina sp. FSL W7-1349]|uniref:alpha/beta fold hydrolase n=1 Tax=Sporosarcina sp. FSL W7-1349 TaxID=2921561 RepID=UPI0030FBECDD
MISENKIITEGYSTFLLESGNKENETIILLHGGGPGASAASNWQDFIPGLTDQFHVLAPDLLGYGKTDHPEDMPKSLRGWMRLRVNQVLSMMDQYEIKSAHIVGNSMGGSLAMHLLMTAPNRFNRISLMGSAGGKAEPTQEVERMVNFYKDPSISALENLTKWFVYDESILQEKVDSIIKDRYEELMRPEVRRSFESFFSSSPAEMAIPPSALRRMEHPILITHGREDRFVTPDSSVYLNQHIPNSQLHIFNHCGHWIQIEKRDSYLQLLKGFLNEKF